MRRSSCGAEEARAHLPELLERANRGGTTVITRHGKPYAALVPIRALASSRRRASLLALRGSGKGLWSEVGEDLTRTISKLRDEWP